MVCVVWPCLRKLFDKEFSSVQFTQSCPTLCNPMNCSMPGLPVHHQLPEFTQTHAYWGDDAIQPSHPLSSPSPSALNLSHHQVLFKWVSSSHQVAKVLEFQLQHLQKYTVNILLNDDKLDTFSQDALITNTESFKLAIWKWIFVCEMTDPYSNL